MEKIKSMKFSALLLICGLLLIASADPVKQGKKGEAPEQRPEDPGAVSGKMEGMKREADKVVAGAREGSGDEEAFRLAALQIYCEMRPEFGPANAWLFNERARKVEALAKKMGIAPDQAEKLFDPAMYDDFCGGLKAVENLARDAGYAAESRPVDRTALLWDPAPGYAVSVTDKSKEVDWVEPYAGTPAGPADATPVKRNPRLTVFVFPPLPGGARRGWVTRHQPGEPYFFAGSLVAFTLQVPQSHDASPDEIAEKLLARAKATGLLRAPKPEAIAAAKKAAGDKAEVKDVNGFVMVQAESLPPALDDPAFRGSAVLWIAPGGSGDIIRLVFH